MTSLFLVLTILLSFRAPTLASDNGGTVWSIAKSLLGYTADNSRPVDGGSGSESSSKPTLRLIGAGFGRTGTTSIKAALEKLDYAPVHHGSAVFDRNLFSEWAAILREQDKVKRQGMLRDIMDGYEYQATLDFPACLVYQDLMESVVCDMR